MEKENNRLAQGFGALIIAVLSALTIIPAVGNELGYETLWLQVVVMLLGVAFFVWALFE